MDEANAKLREGVRGGAGNTNRLIRKFNKAKKAAGDDAMKHRLLAEYYDEALRLLRAEDWTPRRIDERGLIEDRYARKQRIVNRFIDAAEELLEGDYGEEEAAAAAAAAPPQPPRSTAPLFIDGRIAFPATPIRREGRGQTAGQMIAHKLMGGYCRDPSPPRGGGDRSVELLQGAGLHELAKQIKDITAEKAASDYANLKDAPCSATTAPSLSKIGNQAADRFFFEKRLKTKSKRGDSFEEFVKRRGHLEAPYKKRLYNFSLDHGSNHTKAMYSVFNLYQGAVNAFKPLVAKNLYCKFKPKTVLDFSAGWGGRMLGAMATDTNYIGFDTNTNLRKAYADMIKAYPHDCKVSIHFQDSAKVDYSRYTYDMVFTSPPYFLKTKPTEAYEKMPHYTDRDDFNKRFFFPVVEKTWKHLQSGGHYCLNIPMDMYEDIKTILGPCSSKTLLPKVSRGKGGGENYKEYIYVWNKGASGGGGIRLSHSRLPPLPTSM